ncbi:Agmo, partial [Symbiodinium sp. KB8]
APKKQPITLDGPWGTPLCASLFYTVFALTLLYASGLNYLLLNLLTQMGVRPSQALLAVFLPFNTLLGEDPASLLQVRQNGYLDTDGIRGLVFSGALPFFVLAIGVEIAGAVLVFGRRLHRVNDSINSLSMGLGDQLCGAVIGSMLVGPYAAIHSKCALLHVDWTHNAAAWWGGFLAVDLAYYWFHRCSHEVSFLWASHAVHHGSEEYNLTTALRQSFWGSAGFVFYLPLAFLFPLELALAHKVINLLFQFWIHTRTVGRLGPLEWVLNTPSAHRVHHGRNPWCIDKNFAGTLIIWDRLFCTYQAEEEVDEEIVYGVVPPLATWQPVWGQTHHYVEMAHNIYRTPGCCNKLQLLVRPPGWQWDGRKNRCRHFAVPRIGHKVNPLAPYDPPLHPLLTTYAAVQFGTMLLGYFVLVTSVPESGSDSVSRGAAVAVYAAATAIFAQGLVSIAA